MKTAIIGLSGAGKSSLFQLLTGSPAPLPGSRPEPRLGTARVPDARVGRLAEMFQPKKTTLATVEYVDLPGVAKGEGSALVELPALRGVDAFLHVVRAFDSDSVAHPEGSVDPARDAALLELELVLADLGAVERRLERLEANIKKAKKPEDVAERELFMRLREGLEAERPLRALALDADERRRLRGYGLLSEKPLLIVANLSEDRIRQAEGFLEQSGLAGWRARPGVGVLAVSAPIEAEMTELGAEDARAFREELCLAEPGLERVIGSTYELLGLISFLTAGEDECRAWTIPRGTRAVAAAGAIHSDIERGFIRAQVVAFEALAAAGSLAACREKGTLRLEGRDYEVRDGDVIEFKFNV